MKNSNFEGWAGLIAAFLLLGAALTTSYQVVLWLRNGFWPPVLLDVAVRWLDVNSVNYLATMQWEGAKKICTWILGLPLSVAFVALAFIQFCALDWLRNALADNQSRNPSDLILRRNSL